jgi:hypothetical protein
MVNTDTDSLTNSKTNQLGKNASNQLQNKQDG